MTSELYGTIGIILPSAPGAQASSPRSSIFLRHITDELRDSHQTRELFICEISDVPTGYAISSRDQLFLRYHLQPLRSQTAGSSSRNSLVPQRALSIPFFW